MDFFIQNAYAQGAQPQGGGTSFIIMMVLMFAAFYFLLIRPQQKKAKEHRALLDNLKKGDRIITSGGLYGRITGVSEATLTVEIADKVRVKVARGNVGAVVQPGSGSLFLVRDENENRLLDATDPVIGTFHEQEETGRLLLEAEDEILKILQQKGKVDLKR